MSGRLSAVCRSGMTLEGAAQWLSLRTENMGSGARHSTRHSYGSRGLLRTSSSQPAWRSRRCQQRNETRVALAQAQRSSG